MTVSRTCTAERTIVRLLNSYLNDKRMSHKWPANLTACESEKNRPLPHRGIGSILSWAREVSVSESGRGPSGAHVCLLCRLLSPHTRIHSFAKPREFESGLQEDNVHKFSLAVYTCSNFRYQRTWLLSMILSLLLSISTLL